MVVFQVLSVFQVYVCGATGEHMPMWAPPTPPQDDHDLYIDHTMSFLYEPSTMSESQLPQVYVKKEHKRVRIDHTIAAARKMKVRKEEQPRVPRSLFDRPLTALRKDSKLLKLRQQSMAGLKPGFQKPQTSLMQSNRPVAEPQAEWLVNEDWALLQALQTLQELPLSLQANSPAHIANWDLVADVVNACSRTYRSSKQCRNRYESVIVPREEGKILYDINPRKQKKSKGIYKQTKNNRPMRTSQIHTQDNNGALTSLFTHRFDSVKSISSKRTPTLRPTLANPTLKNPKHAAVLAEGGINYDQPLTPSQVAAIRAERLAKEKKQAAAVEQQQQLRTVQQPAKASTPQVSGQPQVAATVAQVVTATVATTSAVSGHTPMTIVQQASQLQHVVSSSNVMTGSIQKAVQGSAVAAVARSLGTGSIVVNATGSPNTFSQINKRMGQAAVVQGSALAQSIANTLTTSTVAQAIQRQGRTTAGLTVQELQAVVNRNPAIRAATLGAAGLPSSQVITTTALTPVQLMAAQKAGTVTVTSVTTGGTVQQQLAQVPAKKLTQQQLMQFTRHQAILKQQQAQLRQNASQASITALQQAPSAGSMGNTVQTLQKTVAVSAPLITSITQVSGSQTHLQVAKPTLKQGMVTEEMAALLKRQQLQQQGKVLTTASGQQVQVSQGQLTRLTAAQIISGTQVQQVTGQQTSGQPMTAAIVKTMAPQSNVPLSLGISVNMPQQKTVKAPQVQAIRFQQHPQAQQVRKATPTTITQHQQKVAALQQLQQVTKGSGGSTPLLIPPQQSGGLHKVMVQQVMVKQPASGSSSQNPTIQQIVTTPLQTTSGAVGTTHMVTQQRPSVTLTTALAQQQQSGSRSSVVSSGGTSLVSHPVTITQGATLVKQVQELVGNSPQHKSLTPQVKTVQQVTTVRQLPTAQSVQVLQQPGQAQQQVVKQLSTPTTNVQQAVQQVLQQAQSQVVQQQRPAVVSSSASPQVTVTTVTQQAVNPVGVSAAQQQQMVVTSAQQQQAAAAAAAAQGGDKSPYAMRLRNQRS